MAYWIHYTGSYLAYGSESIDSYKGCKILFKDEFFKVDYIANLESPKLINRTFYECFARLGKDTISKTICAIHLEDPIIVNYSHGAWDVTFSQLNDTQIADIRLEHLAGINRHEAKFLRKCQAEVKIRDGIIDDFENRLDDEIQQLDSPVDNMDMISINSTGESDDMDFGFDFEEDADDTTTFEFDTNKPDANKTNKNNNLTLF